MTALVYVDESGAHITVHDESKAPIREQERERHARVRGYCAYCGRKAEGNHAIHRDGFSVGPEVPLCDACGGSALPTCEEIWLRIARSGRFYNLRRAAEVAHAKDRRAAKNANGGAA